MDFLQLEGKAVLVVGVANKKSVAWHVARVLTEAGARVIYSVRSEARKNGMLYMQEEGLRLVVKGSTSLAELQANVK